MNLPIDFKENQWQQRVSRWVMIRIHEIYPKITKTRRSIIGRL